MLNTSSSDAVVSCSALLKSVIKISWNVIFQNQRATFVYQAGDFGKILVCFEMEIKVLCR